MGHPAPPTHPTPSSHLPSNCEKTLHLNFFKFFFKNTNHSQRPTVHYKDLYKKRFDSFECLVRASVLARRQILVLPFVSFFSTSASDCSGNQTCCSEIRPIVQSQSSPVVRVVFVCSPQTLDSLWTSVWFKQVGTCCSGSGGAGSCIFISGQSEKTWRPIFTLQ